MTKENLYETLAKSLNSTNERLEFVCDHEKLSTLMSYDINWSSVEELRDERSLI